jgi:hypothetical protein
VINLKLVLRSRETNSKKPPQSDAKWWGLIFVVLPSRGGIERVDRCVYTSRTIRGTPHSLVPAHE